MQNHRQCNIYQYFGNDSLHRELVCTQTFNEKGKVIHEICNGYQWAMIPNGSERANVKEDGTHRYFYNDTLLVEKRRIFPDYADSDVYYYFYNGKKQLIAETIKLRKDSIFTLEYNKWLVRIFGGDTSTYIYDKNGRKLARYEPREFESFYYDDKGRLAKDSMYDRSAKEHRVVNYRYYDDSYQAESFSSECGCVEMVESFQLDEKNRVKEYTLYFLGEKDSTISRQEIFELRQRITSIIHRGR